MIRKFLPHILALTSWTDELGSSRRMSDVDNERLPPMYGYYNQVGGSDYDHQMNGNPYAGNPAHMPMDYVPPSARRYTPEEAARLIRRIHEQQ